MIHLLKMLQAPARRGNPGLVTTTSGIRENPQRQTDVLIVGAGLSGIGAAGRRALVSNRPPPAR
jgi:hypothetical protein